MKRDKKQEGYDGCTKKENILPDRKGKHEKKYLRREKKYKEVLKNNVPEELVGIIKMTYLRKMKRLEEGKRNTVVDERYFRIAEKTLYTELGFALHMDRDEVCRMITEYYEG